MQETKQHVIRDRNFFNKQINRLNRALETRSESEDRSTEIIQTGKKKKRMAAGERNGIELSKHVCDEIRGSYILEDTIPEAEKGSGAEEIFQETMAKHFPKLKKDKSQTENFWNFEKDKLSTNIHRYFGTLWSNHFTKKKKN